MKKHCVELQQTGQFSQFFLDYIGGKKELTPFYSHSPKLGSFEQAIQQKIFSSEKRKVLVEALQSQYANLEVSYAVSKNIDALGSQSTFTVTTGHQLNQLF